jgi:hypothetical protein
MPAMDGRLFKIHKNISVKKDSILLAELQRV